LTVAGKIRESMERASWIRRMFEQGALLKEKWGADKVFDFSLGNPCFDPPPEYMESLKKEIEAPPAGKYAYMANAGYPKTREAIAQDLRQKRKTPFEDRHILMTCGAAGGLNVILKALLDPGDEVLIFSPFFPEYHFYVDNHGGKVSLVETNRDFSLDLSAIEKAITPKTKAILVNSPNNPTGKMYDQQSLIALGELLATAAGRMNKPLYLISDEPYGEIVFDGKQLPNLFECYPNTLVVNSYSKSLSIPGERLGYIAVHPDIEDLNTLLDGLTFCNRILGFVNAPATPQRALGRVPGSAIDATKYQRLRDLLCQGLKEAGYGFLTPEGAFYLFPQSPIPDDVAFVQALLEEGILVVPGSGFGRPGFFRIAYCVEQEVITNALPGFARVYQRYID